MSKKSSPKITMKNPNDLIAYVFNNKDHPEEQIDNIASSIQLFGFKNPVIVDKENVIIAWHGRVLASKKLLMESIPCIVADDLSDEEVRALRIADNKIAEQSVTNFENLKTEMESIDIPFMTELVNLTPLWELDMSWIEWVDLSSMEDDYDPKEDEMDEANIRWYSIKYELVFDDESQKEKFYDFLKVLGEKYDWETIAERLMQHIADFTW